MKKIMIALAVVAMAVVSQAASIKWQVKNASDYKGWNVYVYSGDYTSIGAVLATVLPEAEAPAGWTSNLSQITAGSGTISNRGALTNQTTDDVNESQTWTVVLLNGAIAEVRSMLSTNRMWLPTTPTRVLIPLKQCRLRRSSRRARSRLSPYRSRQVGFCSSSVSQDSRSAAVAPNNLNRVVG